MVRLFDVKIAQNVLNKYDTTESVNEVLEKCKWFLNMVSIAPLDRSFAEANRCYPHYKSCC